MKKKKLIVGAIVFLVVAILFLSINKYLLNKDNINNNAQVETPDVTNKDDDMENKDINEPSSATNNEDNLDNNKSDEKINNSSENNTNSNSNSNKNNQSSVENNNSSVSNTQNNLAETYPALAKITGKEETKGTTKNGFTISEIEGVTYIDGIMMVNKAYGLPSDYLPVNTVESCQGKTTTCNKCINKTAYSSFNKMKADAAALGLNIYIASGYRPYVGQESIYNRYIKRDGKTAADTYSARPGFSEHQTSYSFDLNSINDSFANTNEGKWVNENAYLYGFIIRFPKGKDSYTGYKYEPWHLRYVGYDLAKKLYNNGNWISLEEYFGVDSKYQD